MTGQSLGTASPTEQLAADMSELLDRCQGLLAKRRAASRANEPHRRGRAAPPSPEVRQAVNRRSQGDIGIHPGGVRNLACSMSERRLTASGPMSPFAPRK